MTSSIYPLLIVFIILASFLNSFLLLTLMDYVNSFKASKGNINFFQILRLNLKKLSNSLINQKRILNFGEFFSRLVIYIVSIFLIVEMILGNEEIEKYGVMLLFFFNILGKGVEYFYADRNINLTKYLNTSITCLIFFTITYGLSTIVLDNVEEIGFSIVVMKLFVFLNIVVIVYITEFLLKKLKSSKNIVDEIYSKVLFYFLMISIFVYLNSFSSTDKSILKFFYYTMSILLIEFMSAYVRKNIGKINDIQINNYIYRYWLVFVLFCFLGIIGGQYVL